MNQYVQLVYFLIMMVIKKMNLDEAKPISNEEYLKILEDIKETNDLLIRFKKKFNR